MADRKFAPDRYRKIPGFFLDYDNGGYTNTHGVRDGEKDTGITVTESGHSNVPGSHVRRVAFKGNDYPMLRDAIFAYEDDLAALSENVQQ